MAGEHKAFLFEEQEKGTRQRERGTKINQKKIQKKKLPCRESNPGWPGESRPCYRLHHKGSVFFGTEKYFPVCDDHYFLRECSSWRWEVALWLLGLFVVVLRGDFLFEG